MSHFEFCLQPSRWLLRYLWALHLFVLVACWYFPVPIATSVIFTVLVVASLLFGLRRWRQPSPVLVVSDDKWSLREAVDQEIILQPPCHISRWLVVMPLKVVATGKRSRLVVPFDSLEKQQYRRLKVQLQLAVS